MNKIFLGIMVGILALSMVMAVSDKATPKTPADYNGLHKGKSDVSHLYLYEKDPSTWEIVDGGAWGKMTYSEKGFVFNGHGLEAGESYTLIDNAEWGVEVINLGVAIADSNGNVHVSGDNAVTGAKVWLVLSSDVNSQMTAWNPTEYLFEYDTI